MTFWQKLRFLWHQGFWPTEKVIRYSNWLNNDDNFPIRRKIVSSKEDGKNYT